MRKRWIPGSLSRPRIYREPGYEAKRGEDEFYNGIDISMLLDGKRDPSLEDSQELLGVAAASPTIETSRTALEAVVSQGSEEGRHHGERPCLGLPIFTNHGRRGVLWYNSF